MEDWLALVLGILVGAIIGFLLAKFVRGSEGENLTAAKVRLDEANKNFEAQRRLILEDQERLSQAFRDLAAGALRSNNEDFLRLAKSTLDVYVAQADGSLGKREEAIKGLVKPISEALAKYEIQIHGLEEKRQAAYGSLENQLKSLATQQAALEKETNTLATALRNPQVRGRWGEITLQRVAELAGMTEYCDFETQSAVGSEEGVKRPDMTVRLPSDRIIVVDTKVPLDAYLRYVQATTPADRERYLADHAKALRSHIRALSEKAYWAQFPTSPEFVLLFVPGESFFSAALEADGTLIEEGAKANVILATPTTLIALLRAVHYGWRQEKIATDARAIGEMGAELYDRLRVMTTHLEAVGVSVGKSVESYNKLVGSYESRVLSSAKKLRAMGAAGGDEIPEMETVDKQVRGLSDREGNG
jgi:DNA recombination protein RmuC